MKASNIRRVSQGIFLLLFLYLFLQTESKGKDELGYPVKLFLDFDPLVFVTTLLSAHSVAKWFFLSLFIIMLTIILGRVFCGWVCPLGTLNNIIGRWEVKSEKWKTEKKDWNKIKYYILVFLLFSSLFTLQLVGIMDPISLLIRSLSISIYPLFNYAIRFFFDTVYLHGGSISNVTEPIYSILKKTLLSFQQPIFSQNLFIGSIFIGILLLNLSEKRFWCKFLCPLGALLGLFSRYSLLNRKVSEGCNSCNLCNMVCQGGTNPHKKEEWKKAECIYCLNCDDICPDNAVNFGFFLKGGVRQGIDLGRRRVVVSALSGVIAIPLFKVSPFLKAGFSNPVLIRPPGALPEGEFLKRCVKCGECMKVCITNGLQPTLFEAGLEGIWSPMLVPRLGYCEYRCTLCGQVCPTEAIKRLELSEKVKVKIGLAAIDKNRCLPYAQAIDCIVCEEVCPTPKKAIWFEEAKVRNREGRVRPIKQPVVDLELCIGCGICETRCPVVDKPAIYVTSIGESRSNENQILLGGYRGTPKSN
ncbi:MAG: 4Fe-4S binding protein [Nitrospirota bacterium]